MPHFEREADGTVSGQFTQLESELIVDLARQVSSLLETEVSEHPLAALGIGGGDALSGDPAIARLLPDAYRDDPDRSREFRNLTENSLIDRKRENARMVIDGLTDTTDVTLDADNQQAWLRAIGDIRMVLAARLGIETDDHEPRAETDDELMMYDIYDWLASVQGALIDAIDV
jgi:hypothetical protein